MFVAIALVMEMVRRLPTTTTVCTSTKDVKELSMAKSKFVSYIPRQILVFH